MADTAIITFIEAYDLGAVSGRYADARGRGTNSTLGQGAAATWSGQEDVTHAPRDFRRCPEFPHARPCLACAGTSSSRGSTRGGANADRCSETLRLRGEC